MGLLLPYGMRSRLHHARTGLERGVRNLLFRGAPSWHRRPNALPWFDQPDALDEASRRTTSADERTALERWVRDGYVVLSGLVDPADIDAMVATLDGLWDAPTPIANLELLDLRDEPGGVPRNVTHAALLALPAEQRTRMRAHSNWRIHGFHYVNAAAHRIFHAARLRGVVERILGRPARPFAAINFMRGSQQNLHQDMAVFHIYPHNFLVGAWIACEDVTADSGPLVLHAGSHRSRMFPGFDDYPQTNLRTADAATSAAYQTWVDECATRYERHEFLARKGEILLWHGMLIHGGAPVARPGTTRKSFVLHYTVRGADRAREVRGSFNW
ncbi:MAG: phytanoyl-CoA dioxygenase family protein [Candidatus Binatia bacterium]